MDFGDFSLETLDRLAEAEDLEQMIAFVKGKAAHDEARFMETFEGTFEELKSLPQFQDLELPSGPLVEAFIDSKDAIVVDVCWEFTRPEFGVPRSRPALARFDRIDQLPPAIVSPMFSRAEYPQFASSRHAVDDDPKDGTGVLRFHWNQKGGPIPSDPSRSVASDLIPETVVRRVFHKEADDRKPRVVKLYCNVARGSSPDYSPPAGHSSFADFASTLAKRELVIHNTEKIDDWRHPDLQIIVHQSAMDYATNLSFEGWFGKVRLDGAPESWTVPAAEFSVPEERTIQTQKTLAFGTSGNCYWEEMAHWAEGITAEKALRRSYAIKGFNWRQEVRDVMQGRLELPFGSTQCFNIVSTLEAGNWTPTVQMGSATSSALIEKISGIVRRLEMENGDESKAATPGLGEPLHYGSTRIGNMEALGIADQYNTQESSLLIKDWGPSIGNIERFVGFVRKQGKKQPLLKNLDSIIGLPKGVSSNFSWNGIVRMDPLGTIAGEPESLDGDSKSAIRPLAFVQPPPSEHPHAEWIYFFPNLEITSGRRNRLEELPDDVVPMIYKDYERPLDVSALWEKNATSENRDPPQWTWWERRA
jgi:hypothetical protein